MSGSVPAADVTEDRLLGGRVLLRQPRQGYRAAIDPPFLAAAVPAATGETILDIGCGTGAAMLCLARRVEGCRVTGIEPQRELVRLAGDNITLNDVGARVTVMSGDLLRPPPRLEPGSFAHTMANPPHLEATSVTPPPDRGRAAAHVEGEADLAAWIKFALTMVKPKGSITFIHRADRLDQLLAQLSGRAGEISLFPLWAGAGKQAKRVILRARKGVMTPMRVLPGLVLHEADGAYTAAADAVLRGGAALVF